ncbi:transmembrane protein 14C isoform X2 [Rhinolophus ferrumequinum]|uniref:transmembrane protein 14C isoform X2 n=1 Tax=Rhinolophus ferrumequinum TaxID=59479 RepID=UPI00140FBD12|nr:transmembrane protein 14C isoform X2 [Rhinolophus ferrumequinum]
MQKDSGPLVPLHWIGFGYAALVASGGIIGYAKAVTSGTLAGIMGMRFYHSGKFMPAGLIAGASLLMVAKLGISVLNGPRQS